MARENIAGGNAMKHFYHNSILCYLVSSLCSVVRKFFVTDKRSGVAEHEEKKKIISQGKSPQAATQNDYEHLLNYIKKHIEVSRKEIEYTIFNSPKSISSNRSNNLI